MSKEIRCEGCNQYLGNITKAKLHKDIKFLCFNCNTKRIASDLAKKSYPPISDEATINFMKGMFGFNLNEGAM